MDQGTSKGSLQKAKTEMDASKAFKVTVACSNPGSNAYLGVGCWGNSLTPGPHFLSLK